MPSIKNIDKFVQLLNSLGDEPEILNKRGQNIEPAVIPDKNPETENPFLVNIEDDADASEDLGIPDLGGDLESFDDDLFDDDDFDLGDNDEAPELEEDDSFSLDGLDDLLDDTTPIDIDDIDELDDTSPIDFDDIDELDDTSPIDLDDIDELDDTSPIDFDDIDELDDISPIDLDDISDDLEPLDDLDDTSPIDFDDIGDDLEPLDELDELDDISILDNINSLDDEVLDTSPETLDDGIEEINLDDIGLDDTDEDEELPSGFDELSIEDEVLEDDFGSLEDDDADEFSLGDFGDSFNFDKEASTSALALEEFTEAATEEEPEVQETKYTKEEFDSIKKTMAGLPLNVKIIIEEEISENGLFGTKLDGLVELLIDNAPVKDIVKYLNKILGHKVKLSSSFVKLTALDFEKQKEKFTYILINTVFPKIKWIFPITLLLAMIYLAGYFWGYKIFKAEDIYKEGHELILVDRYEDAFDKFLEAFNTHRKMKWYHIYADTYYDRKAFDYAEKVYLQILNEDSDDLNAILSYSRMKGFDQGEYAKATNFLTNYMDHGLRDYDLMITLADIYMKWAEVEPSRYEDARLWYAETMTTFGPKPNILFKYLNYFIKTDKLQEVQTYRRMFEISKNVEVDGDIYARMAGYLMDKGIVETVRDTLFRGIEDHPRNPNLHYQLARYFESIGSSREVEKAARNAVFYYEYGGYLSAEELSSLVDTKRMLGELYSKDERYLSSEKNFQEAVSLYENLQERNFVEKEPRFGKIYSDYGDIFYYAGNSLSTAYNLYSKAQENDFKSDELSYKKGYIKYQENSMADALSEFHSAEDVRNLRESILFAKANTLSYRGSYNSALTYYNKHLKYLQQMEEEEETLYPTENESHLALIENYIRVYNNIGVNLYKLNGEKSLPEVGMAFTKSTEYYDYLTRDPDFLVRSGLKDLAYYNTRAILYPDKEMELLLYNTISRDFEDKNLGIVSTLE